MESTAFLRWESLQTIVCTGLDYESSYCTEVITSGTRCRRALNAILKALRYYTEETAVLLTVSDPCLLGCGIYLLRIVR